MFPIQQRPRTAGIALVGGAGLWPSARNDDAVRSSTMPQFVTCSARTREFRGMTRWCACCSQDPSPQSPARRLRMQRTTTSRRTRSSRLRSRCRCKRTRRPRKTRVGWVMACAYWIPPPPRVGTEMCFGAVPVERQGRHTRRLVRKRFCAMCHSVIPAPSHTPTRVSMCGCVCARVWTLGAAARASKKLAMSVRRRTRCSLMGRDDAGEPKLQWAQSTDR